MNNKVPYIVVESIIASHERTVKRLCIVIILLIAAIIISNFAWICYENSFEPLAEEFDLSVKQIKNIVYKNEIIIFNKLGKDLMI